MYEKIPLYSIFIYNVEPKVLDDQIIFFSELNVFSGSV